MFRKTFPSEGLRDLEEAFREESNFSTLLNEANYLLCNTGDILKMCFENGFEELKYSYKLGWSIVALSHLRHLLVESKT